MDRTGGRGALTTLVAIGDVAPGSGYRRYGTDQVMTAQVIRRFRELGMPIEQVKAVLDAPHAAARNEIIVAHLRRMEAALEQTQATVASLRALLGRSATAVAVEYRSVAAITTLAIGETVAVSDIARWWREGFEELYAALDQVGLEPAGPAGSLYSSEFFEQHRGEVVVYVPVTFVAEREIGVEGPIREHHLVGPRDTGDEQRHRTEVCWPVFHTGRDG